MLGGNGLMFFATCAIGLWSLVAAWMLHTGRAEPGDVWGWSRVGNVVQGVGLLMLSAGILLTNAGATLSGVGRVALLYAPWFIVVVSFGLRMRARRDAGDEARDAPEKPNQPHPPEDSR